MHHLVRECEAIPCYQNVTEEGDTVIKEVIIGYKPGPSRYYMDGVEVSAEVFEVQFYKDMQELKDRNEASNKVSM